MQYFLMLCAKLMKKEGDDHAIKAGGILSVMEKFFAYFGLQLSVTFKLFCLGTAFPQSPREGQHHVYKKLYKLQRLHRLIYKDKGMKMHLTTFVTKPLKVQRI